MKSNYQFYYRMAAYSQFMRYAATTIGAGTIFFFWFIWIYRPMMQAIVQEKIAIAQLNHKQQAQEVVDQKNNLKVQAQEHQVFFTHKQPLYQVSNATMTFLIQEANKVGLKAEKISLGSLHKKEWGTHIQLPMILQGTFEQFNQLLQSLEASKRFISIFSCRFDKQEQNSYLISVVFQLSYVETSSTKNPPTQNKAEGLGG